MLVAPEAQADTPGPGPEPSPRPVVRRRAPRALTVLAFASLGVFIAFVDATIVNIAFPDIVRSFPDTSISGLSWVLNAYNIVFAAFLVAAGRIADLLGRRRVFLLGLTVFTLASALCAAAPSAGSLIAFRVLQALGAALLVPSSLGLVLEAFPADRRSHAVALLTAVGAVAAGVGPSLGGLLVTASSWRLVFLVNIPVGIAAYLLSRRHLVESRAPGRRRLPDISGSLFFALAVAALVLGVIKGEEWGWSSPRVVGSFAAAVILGAVVVWRCTWHRSPIVDMALLRIRTFTAANAMSVLAAAGFYGYTLANVLFLTGVWHYSVLDAGLAITPGPFVAAAVAGPSSRMAERYGHRVVLSTGGLVWGAAVLWLTARVGPTPAFVSEWLPATVLLGLGAGITLPNLSGAAVASAPGESFATATGLNSVARQVGAALGVAIVVAIIGTPSPAQAPAAFDNAWYFAAACLLAAGAGSLLIGRVGAGDDVSRTPSLSSAARAVLPLARTDPILPLPGPPRPAPPSPAAPPPDVRQPESTEQFLARVPMFAGLSAPMRAALARRARVVRVAAGDWLFREGDAGDAMYVVRAGRLQLSRDGGSVRELGRGIALGELSLLTSSPRSASVRAARHSELIAIDRDDFQRLLQDAPELALALTRVLGDHLRESRPVAPDVRPLPSTIALIALDAGVPVTDLAARLADALRWHGRVAVLDGREVEPPPPGTTPAAAYGPLLDRAEGEGDRVLLVAAATAPDEPWTQFCLQQGDRLLAVAHEAMPAGAPPRLELRGCDLVAYDVAPGSGVLAGWAESLDPLETHALPHGPELDAGVARIARRLSGCSLGIVLSGGGARAFAHIGVLEELTAAGVVIDRVGGVSMGAFVGAMFASGMDADEMDAHCYEEWVRRRPLRDYTLPRHGLIRGARVAAMLERVFGTLAIEELSRGFFCASADLRAGQLVVSRSGPLADSIGLSLCMPVLAPPQVRGRQLLVDGSLIDNLPMATMAALGEGPLIAVDVKASFDRDGRTKARQGEIRTPSLAETLTRVLLLASANTSAAAARYADLTIAPQSDGVGLLEFHQLDRAREAGRRAARDALERTPAAMLADPGAGGVAGLFG
jgi:NTE family protein